jgi:hypothetical protein
LALMMFFIPNPMMKAQIQIRSSILLFTAGADDNMYSSHEHTNKIIIRTAPDAIRNILSIKL